MEPLSLFDFNNLLKQTLDLNLEPSYWLIAEIGEMRLNQKGHCYMELVEKEEDTVRAKIRANIWAYTYRNLSGWFQSITGRELQPGLKILANITVNFHELYGLSLTIKDIDPNFTLGERAKRKLEVIEQLRQEGVLTMNRELELPVAPQRIAVISSSTAAGLGDFLDQLKNNEHNYGFKVKLFQALVQGDQASQSIIEAMHHVYEQINDFDVLVIIRGGGAQVDLDCFDNYELAAHVAQFPIPVITGIGHERDETITDIVAHTKLKTPTAVANFLIAGLTAFEEKIDLFYAKVWQIANRYLNQQQHLLNHLNSELIHSSRHFIMRREAQLNDILTQLKIGSKTSLNKQNIKLLELRNQIKIKPFLVLKNHFNNIVFIQKTIELLDPQQILKRGYSITTINGKSPDKIKSVKKGMTVVTRTVNQVLESDLKNIKTIKNKTN